MNISKLTKALSPANLAELSEITISPAFSITICYATAGCQQYQAAVAKFGLSHPTHDLFKDFERFSSELLPYKVTTSTLQFLAHVVVAGWELTDDDGGKVPYSPEAFLELMTGEDEFQRTIPAKLLRACLDSQTFKVDLVVKP